MSNYQPYADQATTGTPGYAPSSGSGTGLPSVYPDMPVPGPTLVYGRPEHPQATTVLVLGILSLVGVSIVGPIAWHMGNKGLKECEAGVYSMTDPLRIGRILGIIGTILLIIGVAFVIVYLILMAAIFGFAMR